MDGGDINIAEFLVGVDGTMLRVLDGGAEDEGDEADEDDEADEADEDDEAVLEDGAVGLVNEGGDVELDDNDNSVAIEVVGAVDVDEDNGVVLDEVEEERCAALNGVVRTGAVLPAVEVR